MYLEMCRTTTEVESIPRVFCPVRWPFGPRLSQERKKERQEGVSNLGARILDARTRMHLVGCCFKLVQNTAAPSGRRIRDSSADVPCSSAGDIAATNTGSLHESGVLLTRGAHPITSMAVTCLAGGMLASGCCCWRPLTMHAIRVSRTWRPNYRRRHSTNVSYVASA